MRKNTKSFMLFMTPEEKAFIDEMAWRMKIPIARYIKMLIHGEMEKNPKLVESLKQRLESGNNS